jgi:integrase
MARGDGRVYKRGGVYWIAYYARKQPTDTRLKEICEPGGFDGRGTHDEKEARRKLKARIREIRGDRYIGPEAEKLEVNELLKAYEETLKLKGAKSLKATELQLRPVRAFFGMTRAMAIGPDLVRAFIAARQKEGRAPATINRGIACLRAAFNLARKEGRLIRVPHFPTLRENNVRQGFFEKPEIDRVITYLDEPIDDVVLFAFATGWRKAEILGLRWEDVDRDGSEIRLRDSKNNEPRSIPISGEIHELIERRWRSREYKKKDKDKLTRISELVFHKRGKPIKSFFKSWDNACNEAKCPGRLFHDLRRSAIRDMVRAGVPEVVAMKVSGHKTRATFERYNIVSNDDKRDALKSLEAFRATRSAASNVTTLKPRDGVKP